MEWKLCYGSLQGVNGGLWLGFVDYLVTTKNYHVQLSGVTATKWSEKDEYSATSNKSSSLKDVPTSAHLTLMNRTIIKYPNSPGCQFAATSVYRAPLIGGPQVGWMLRASSGRSGKQEQEQNSPNLGPAYQWSPVECVSQNEWLKEDKFQKSNSLTEMARELWHHGKS